MKNQKGITLIALIITIIVMVILAGIAITMAFGENGVIERGQKANTAMEQKNIEETIQTSYYYDKDNAVELDYDETTKAIKENLESAGYTVEFKDSGTDFPIIVTTIGKTGEYTHTVNRTGKITQGENIVIQNPTLTAQQIYNGTYADSAIIKLTPTFYSNEQMIEIIELAYEKESGENIEMEQFIIDRYNAEYGTSYTEISQTGKSLENLVTYRFCLHDDTETLEQVATAWLMYCSGDYEIIRPDGTVFNTTGVTYNKDMNDASEGIGEIDNTIEFYYLAKQKDENNPYQITITLGDYTLTDSVVVTEF